MPRAFFDYVETGSYAQETLRANRTDLERIKLRQRVLIDVSARDLSTTILGDKVPLPLALGPSPWRAFSMAMARFSRAGPRMRPASHSR